MDEPLNIDLFIFDWSGTISDDRKPVYAANMRLLEDCYGIPRIPFNEWLPKTQATPAQYLKVNHGVDVDEQKMFEQYTKYYNEELARGDVPKVYENAEMVLLYLYNREKPLAVLSSHPEQNVKQEAVMYDLMHYFDLVVGNVGTDGKADGILEICKKFNKKPGSVLYTGDTVHDVRAAKAAGVHSAVVYDGYTQPEKLVCENPEFILSNIDILEEMFLIGRLQ